MSRYFGKGVWNFVLSGGTREDIASYYNLIIKDVTIDPEEDSEIRLDFEDGSWVYIRDVGRSCSCESRYITTDDDIKSLVGQKLLKVEVRNGPLINEDWGEHETAFVDIQGDKSSVSLTTHDKHSGYYGGFAFCVKGSKEQ